MKLAHPIRFALPLASLGLAAPALAEPLTPEQALTRAAERSPALRAALWDLRAAGYGVEAEDRARAPVLSGSLHATHGATDGVDASVGVSTTTDVGTVISVGADASFQSGPTSSATFGVDVRQPLLRGGGEDAVLASLREARLEKSAAEADRDQAASQLAGDVLGAYWDVWYAAQALAVQRASLVVTQRQVADMQVKVEKLATAPQTDLLRLRSEAASQRGRVSQAAAELESAQIALARLLGVSLEAATELSAAGEPSTSVSIEPLAALTAAAESESYDLRAQRSSLESAKVGVRAAEDRTQPRLDLVGSLSAGALWNEQFDGFSLDGGKPGIIAMVGLEGELPFGRSRDEANLDGSRARLRAAEARYDLARDELGERVAKARRQLVQAEDNLAIATETAAIAEALADKEAEKLKLGTSVVTDLVLAQQSARESELQRLRAAADVESTRLTLDQLTGALLPRVAAFAPALQASEL